MGIQNSIMNAFNEYIDGVQGGATIPPVYYPNVGKEPTNGQPYMRVTLLPGASELSTLNSISLYKGIYQIDIYTKLNQGTAPALSIGDELQSAFVGTSLSKDGYDIHVQNISPGRMERVESWWHYYIDINYICYAYQ